ncbi:unnamed protein product [Acanthoscelides obtectus]|uniref:Uncharacterized protein n=1 Tax=Acanthoscelides obtectus TaxID=200917 RepID=A0A9P0LTT7_ACAOB|nr:unnamed protein product [Acanthoscelides obtectus]CAK1630290.1 hypothetical protein AOBTE_LOCUS6239 [Acanthoscelides obtectus]
MSKRDTSVKHIFDHMNYRDCIEKMDKLDEWLKTTFFPTLGPNSIDVNDVINKQKLCSVSIPENIDQLVDSILEPDDLDRQKRSMLLEKLATSVEQNSELLAQIEAATRGILLRDTKQKVVPILKEYFIYYSTFPLQYSIDGKIRADKLSAPIL